MKTQAFTGNYTEANVEAIAVAVFKDEKSTSTFLKELDKLTDGLVASVIKDEDFKGSEGQTALIRIKPSGKVKARGILLIGVGDEKNYDAKDVAGVCGTATRFLRKRNVKNFALVPRSNADVSEVAVFAAQSFVTSQYEIDKYKTKDKQDKVVDSFTLCVEGDEKTIQAGLDKGKIIGESMNFTRDLSNEPPNILHPTEMAKRAEKIAKETGLKCEILDEAKMKKLGMGSLLSVSIGSEQPPKMIVLKYEPKKSTGKKGELLALV
ncbi:MAG: leucyl aminopeptidase family protein, partial [Pyrinomonadaceae bacterium]|nr:leucyl aminopeptidase family protein [Pyrinomonadaceae bacterium]